MKLFCTICYDHKPLKYFQFILCGHGFCRVCLATYTATRSTQPCPICRVNFKRVQMHPVFMETDDSPVLDSSLGLVFSEDVLQKAKDTREGLECMGLESTSQIVKGVSKEVKKVVDSMDGSGDSVGDLLRAVADFMDRVSPHFSNIRSLKDKLRQKESEAKHFNEKAAKCESLLDMAVETADDARLKFEGELQQKELLEKKLEQKIKEHEGTVTLKDNEIRKLQVMLLSHKDKEIRQKEKIVDLRNQVEELQATLARVRKPAQTQRRPSQSSFSTRHESSQSQPGPSRSNNVFSSRLLERSLDLSDDGLMVTPSSDIGTEYQYEAPLPKLLPSPPHASQRPQFVSDFTLPQKRKSVTLESASRKAAKSTFPISMDRHGRVQGAVQLGPRYSLPVRAMKPK